MWLNLSRAKQAVLEEHGFVYSRKARGYVYFNRKTKGTLTILLEAIKRASVTDLIEYINITLYPGFVRDDEKNEEEDDLCSLDE